MIRPSAAALALLILSSPAAADAASQEARVREHVVTSGETLWDLSRVYLGNPFDWRTIWEANRDRVPDPHWIYPGQRLVIPGTGMAGPPPAGVITDVQVMPAAQGQPSRPADTRAPDPSERTVFYENPEERASGGVVAGQARPWVAVPRDVFYSAGWLERAEKTPAHAGRVLGFASGEEARSSRMTARPYETLRIELLGSRDLQIGDELLTFRTDRAIAERGLVVVPTGVLTVIRLESAGVVAMVSNEYDRVRVGDFVQPVAAYTQEAGVYAADVADSVRATVVGFQEVQALQGPGDIAFLDLGAADGLSVGDEFVARVSGGSGWSGVVAGRLQVVGLRERTASARIIELDSPIFVEGLEVRLARKMP